MIIFSLYQVIFKCPLLLVKYLMNFFNFFGLRAAEMTNGYYPSYAEDFYYEQSI